MNRLRNEIFIENIVFSGFKHEKWQSGQRVRLPRRVSPALGWGCYACMHHLRAAWWSSTFSLNHKYHAVSSVGEKLPLHESKAFSPPKRMGSGVSYMHPEGRRRVGQQELFTSLLETGSHPVPAFCTNTLLAVDRILFGLEIDKHPLWQALDFPF